MNEEQENFNHQQIEQEKSSRQLLETKKIETQLRKLQLEIEAMSLPFQNALKENSQWEYDINLYCPNNVYNKYQDKIAGLSAIYRTICPEHQENSKQSNKEEKKYQKVLEKVKQLQQLYSNLSLPQLIDKAKMLILSQQNAEKSQKISTLGFIITVLIDLSTQYRKQMVEAKRQYQLAQLQIKSLQQEVKRNLLKLKEKEQKFSKLRNQLKKLIQSFHNHQQNQNFQLVSPLSKISNISSISNRKISKKAQEANKYDHRSSYSQSSSLFQSQQQKIHSKSELHLLKVASLNILSQQQIPNINNKSQEYQDKEFKQFSMPFQNQQSSSCINSSDEIQAEECIVINHFYPAKKIKIESANQKNLKNQSYFEQLDISSIIHHKVSEQSIKEQEECWNYQLPELNNRSVKEPAKNPINHCLLSFPDDQQDQSIIQSIFQSIFQKQAVI